MLITQSFTNIFYSPMLSACQQYVLLLLHILIHQYLFQWAGGRWIFLQIFYCLGDTNKLYHLLVVQGHVTLKTIKKHLLIKNRKPQQSRIIIIKIKLFPQRNKLAGSYSIIFECHVIFNTDEQKEGYPRQCTRCQWSSQTFTPSILPNILHHFPGLM